MIDYKAEVLKVYPDAHIAEFKPYYPLTLYYIAITHGKIWDTESKTEELAWESAYYTIFKKTKL